MNERPRILITYPYPLGRATGGARMTREIARSLGHRGCQVTILPVSCAPWTYFPRPTVEDEFLGFEFDDDLAAAGVRVRRVPSHQLHWLLDARNVARCVTEELTRQPADIVLSYFIEAAALPRLLRARGVAFGFISTMQSYEQALRARKRGTPRLANRWLNRRLIEAPLRGADIVFATSDFTRAEIVDRIAVPDDRVTVCPLGVDPQFFEVPRQRPHSIRRLLFFGRVWHSKGVADAISALGQLSRNGVREVTLRIVGQGDHEWAHREAHRNGVSDRVEVCDAVDDAGLARELAAADVAVLPSHFEAFGLAFAEAQAAGLPVLAFAAGSVPEVVMDGVTGWLAPLGDVDGLAARMTSAISDPAKTHAMGLAAREHVRENFTWANTATTMLAGIQKVLATPTGSHGRHRTGRR